MKLRLRIVSVFALGICVAHSVLHAQNSARSPRVGVALSGGGALGLAHIGVIRYFEEHHIPIDDIAGTSMGGLVGGLYAVGMDSKQMTGVVQEADWNALLSPNPRFIDQPAVDKQEWNRTFGDLTLRFGKRFALPAGLNPGEALSLLLSRTTLAYSNLNSFDELPTPFRCVATDLISGEAVVLKKGSLAQAMRATMSIPAIFTPVKMDGMVLVDGGILQNIPVEVVRGMGSQKVIAVALETPAAKQEQLKSLSDVLRQTVSVAIAQNERRSLASADLVISVDTKRFSGTEYLRWKDIIQAGYLAAQAKAAELEKFELSDIEWQQYLTAKRARMQTAEQQGRVLSVSSQNPQFQKNAEVEIRRKLDDRTVLQHQVEDVLTGMVAATAVPGASYEWKNNNQGTEGYAIKFAQRPSDQVLARLGFLYELSPGEPSRAALKFSVTTIFENAYKDRLLGAANIGYDPGIQLEYYHPFGGSAYFASPGLEVTRYHVNRYQGPAHFSDTLDRFGGSFYAGMGTWRFIQVRAGAEAGYDSYSSTRVVDGIKAESGGFVTPQVRWIYDSQDSGGLPTRGTLLEGSSGYSFRNAAYPFLKNDFTTFYPLGRTLTIFGLSQNATSFGQKLDYFEQFTAGGHSRLGAFRYQEFHANTMLTAGSGLIFHGPPLKRLSINPGFAVLYEAGRFDMGSRGWQTHQSTSTGILFPTPLGAAGITISFDENGKARFRLLLGSLN